MSFLSLAAILLLGIVIVVVDFWLVRKDALRGASSSRFAPFRGTVGLALLSIAGSSFLFLSPLFPWQNTIGFVIAVCSLYALFACLHFVWRIIWLQHGYVRKEEEGRSDVLL